MTKYQIQGRKVWVTKHALIRSRQRFRGLAHKSKNDITKILQGIVHKGSYIGDSYIVGDFYRTGVLDWTSEKVVAVCRETENESISILTVLTESELQNAGAFRQ